MNIPPEVIGYCAAIFTTFSFLPQALLTLRTRDTKTLSLGMYSMFTLGVSIWIAYGIMRMDWVIITANAVTLAFAVMILAVKVHNVTWGNERPKTRPHY